MSIPVDFVGLNTLINKVESKNKNTITSVETPEFFVVPSDDPIELTLEQLLPYDSDLERTSRHLLDNPRTDNQVSTQLKNLSILVNFTLTKTFSPSISSTNLTGTYNTSTSFSSDPIYNIIQSTGSHKFCFSLVNSGTGKVKFTNFAISATRVGQVLPTEYTVNNTKHSLMITMSSREKNLRKSSKSDKNTSNGNHGALYLDGQQIDIIQNSIGSIFDGSGNVTSGKIIDFPKDLKLTFGRVFNNSGTVSGHTSTIHSIVVWNKGLSPEKAKFFSNKKSDFFWRKENGLETINKEDDYFFIYYNNQSTDNSQILQNTDTQDPPGFLNESIADFNNAGQDYHTVFSALMNNLHGPYGYSSFKQLRASQNWLMRSYNKDNTFSFVSENGETITVTKDGNILSTHTKKYGEIQNLTENPVTNQHEPLEMVVNVIDEETQDFEKLSIKGTFSNDTQYFKNNIINSELNTKTKTSLSYEELKSIYEENLTPVDEIEKIIYKQTVYPKNLYTFSKDHRVRPTYSSKIWRDQRASRTELDINNGFGYNIPSQSFWPLDAEENFTTLPASNSYGGVFGYNSFGGAGVLQNSYSLFATSSNQSKFSGIDIDSVVSASILYSRPHTLTASTSVVNPFFTTLSGGAITNTIKFKGHAKWEAGDMAGFFNTDGNFQPSPKKPFPDSYDEWSESFRGLGKDYSIVPEFTISDHVNHYLTNGFTSQKKDYLNIKGGNNEFSNSSLENFYKIYSMSDFLKNFDVVKNDLKNKLSPSSITLRCKAIKKFLPYEGFYPCQRTVDLAKQFYDSYGFFISGSTWNEHFGGSSVSGALPNIISTSKYISQPLTTPLFSPGILFNSIKSGIACDFPAFDYPYVTSSATPSLNEQFISSDIRKRIPFEALMEPEKHLANFELHSMEPDTQAPKVKSIWTGQGDNLYKLMINNFVSEVGNFFLENEKHTTITSLPEGDPNFGNTQPGKTYGMRIKMFRSISGSKKPFIDAQGDVYGIPQDNGPMGESFTMYSRPSAFGPPMAQVIPAAFGNNFKAINWSKFKFSGSIDFSYPGPDTNNVVIAPGFNYKMSGSDQGYNWPFTPPYYHGEAWADVFFQPPDGAKKYSLSEIINNSSVEFFRHYATSSQTMNTLPSGISFPSLLINDQSMQIPSSMNIFSRGILQEDSEGLTINTQIESKYRWIIQSKWETPTLNFNHLSHEDITMPVDTIQRAPTPIGMWHQYGRLPQRTDEGVFVQVTDIPTNWIEGAMSGDINNTGSLVDLCGFSTDPIRVGEIKNTKLIEEAVVAIPFVDRGGFKNFFNLQKQDIQNSLNGNKNLVGDSVNKLVEQLDKYVFPPQFDFIRNEDIQPFAMYVFEFSHNLTKQDLADIWQNLPPKLGDVHETAEATVSHNLFAQEFLGQGAQLEADPNSSVKLDKITELSDLPSNIQWMVFKVKKRAKSNYFEKMFQRNESRDSSEETTFTVDSTGKKSDVSFNWPYDFFSMVELIKLDAEVEFSNVDQEKSELNNKKVIKPYKINKE